MSDLTEERRLRRQAVWNDYVDDLPLSKTEPGIWNQKWAAYAAWLADGPTTPEEFAEIRARLRAELTEERRLRRQAVWNDYVDDLPLSKTEPGIWNQKWAAYAAWLADGPTTPEEFAEIRARLRAERQTS